MKSSSSTSYLISFEGIEACGKSTAIDYLKKNKATLLHQWQLEDIHFFREPGSTALGEKLRSLLIDKNVTRHLWSEVFLFLAARAELIAQHLQPILALPHQLIILDRYIDSTLIYQGMVQGLPLAELKQLHQVAGLNLWPDLTYYFRINAATSLARQSTRNQVKDYFEATLEINLQKMIDGYDNLSHTETTRFSILDAQAPIEKVLQQLNQHFALWLHQRRQAPTP